MSRVKLKIIFFCIRSVLEDPASLQILPKEIQYEILDLIIGDYTNEALLELSTTCKSWNDRISTSSSWLNERLQKYYTTARVKHPGDDEDPEHEAKQRAYEADLLGADRVFSPKIAYYFIIRRSNPPTYRRITRHQIPSDLKLNNDLWVPWLDHNLIRRPDTLWTFIKTILICPKWIYSMMVVKKQRFKGTMTTDRVNLPRITSLFTVLSVSPKNCTINTYFITYIHIK